MGLSPDMARVSQQPTIMFDTHAYVRHMRQGGFSEQQAEASADALTDAFRGAIVTQDVLKRELLVCRDEFRSDIQEFREEVGNEFKTFREEVSNEFKAVREEVGNEFKAFREEVGNEFKAVRKEVSNEFKAVRGEIQAVRGEIQAVRGEIIKSENKLLIILGGAIGASFIATTTLMISLKFWV